MSEVINEIRKTQEAIMGHAQSYSPFAMPTDEQFNELSKLFGLKGDVPVLPAICDMLIEIGKRLDDNGIYTKPKLAGH